MKAELTGITSIYTFNFPSENGCLRECKIIFSKDGFEKIEFNFGNPYSRQDWKILKAIEEKITEIENDIKFPSRLEKITEV